MTEPVVCIVGREKPLIANNKPYTEIAKAMIRNRADYSDFWKKGDKEVLAQLDDEYNELKQQLPPVPTPTKNGMLSPRAKKVLLIGVGGIFLLHFLNEFIGAKRAQMRRKRINNARIDNWGEKYGY